MILDLTPLIPGLAIALAALLLVVWVLSSRKLLGFLFVCVGWLLLFVAVHSDGQASTLFHIAIAGGLLIILVGVMYGMLAARRRAARSRGPVYVPPAQRK